MKDKKPIIAVMSVCAAFTLSSCSVADYVDHLGLDETTAAKHPVITYAELRLCNQPT